MTNSSLRTVMSSWIFEVPHLCAGGRPRAPPVRATFLSRCSLVSPAGWVTYTQEEGEYDFLYVAGEVYDGTIGRWGVELLFGGVIKWVPHGNISSGWDVCWTESRPELPSSLTVFSGGCRVSGGCVVSNSSDDNFTTCALVCFLQDGSPTSRTVLLRMTCSWMASCSLVPLAPEASKFQMVECLCGPCRLAQTGGKCAGRRHVQMCLRC